MEILICTDGSSSSIQSAELISKLGFPSGTQIVVLGVSEDKSDLEKINNSMDQVIKILGVKYSVSKKIRYGNPPKEILAEALDHVYDLVAVGGGGQLGLLHPKVGSTTGMLARKLHTHFLVARNIPERIAKILVCVSGEAPASETVTLGGTWIANSVAQIGLLHVAPSKKEGSSQGTNTDESRDISDGGEASPKLLLERATRQLRQAGVKNEIIPRIRQGLVVKEALDELLEGKYELLVVGAHYQPGQDRWQETLLDDVTDQLLNRSTCSVLII